jgi:Holliday junction resolvase-like predicted endonuclease
VARTAKMFLLERRVKECPCRFDVLAIDSAVGRAQVAWRHKDAFSPQM